MHVVILSARTGWHTDELCRALAERGHTGSVLPYEGLVARLGDGDASVADDGLSSERAPQLFDADAVLARIIPDGSLEQIIYRVDALHWIEERGVPVMNSPRAIERSVDKFYTTALLQEAGLPTPETVVCEGPRRDGDGRRAAAAMGDVIIKPIFGSMGHGMVRVSDPDVAFRVVRALEQMRAVFYVQRAVDHGGRDVRVFVVGGRVLGAIERRAPEGSGAPTCRAAGRRGRSTAAGVGAARAARGGGRRRRLCRRGSAARRGMAPVFVLEVNGIPGWQGLQQATGLDVAGAIVEHSSCGCAARNGAIRADSSAPCRSAAATSA